MSESLPATALPPRARYLVEPLSVDGQAPLSFDPLMIDSLPAEIKSLTGSVRSAQPLKEGGPSVVLLLEAEQGGFVLKIAEGTYRSQELWAEHTAMRILHDRAVPVPEPLAQVRCGDLSFQLREYLSGEPLSTLLETGSGTRMDAISAMGKLLASIHTVDPVQAWTWSDWIDASLELASQNVAAGICDPDEFAPDEPPGMVLDWLLANRPLRPGPVCLLHGDYRPKNILWENGRITGILDWQFVDVGDPYYDLGIIRWYLQDKTEWQQFLNAYGLPELDQQRFQWCEVLQKFLNV